MGITQLECTTSGSTPQALKIIAISLHFYLLTGEPPFSKSTRGLLSSATLLRVKFINNSMMMATVCQSTARVGVTGPSTWFASLSSLILVRYVNLYMQAYFANHKGQWIATARGGRDGNIKFWYADPSTKKNKHEVSFRALTREAAVDLHLLQAFYLVLQDDLHYLHRIPFCLCPCCAHEARG